MKTIFEGTVNGIRYTDQDKFAEALQEAKKNGNYSATTSYRTVNDEPKKKQIGTGFKLNEVLNMLPDFNLDTLNGNPEHDDALQDSFNPLVSGDNLNKVLGRIVDMSLTDRAQLDRILVKKIDELEDNLDNTRTALSDKHKQLADLKDQIKDIHEKIDEVDAAINILKSSNSILTDEQSFYNDLNENLKVKTNGVKNRVQLFDEDKLLKFVRDIFS